jgi:hypothetical protein
MENSAQQSGTDSAHGASLFSSVLFVAVAVMVAVAALWLLPGLGTPQMVLSGGGRVALVVTVMVLGFSGVLVTTLLNLPDTMRRMLVVLFATALLCSGFVALVGWFTVSGASGCWL